MVLGRLPCLGMVLGIQECVPNQILSDPMSPFEILIGFRVKNIEPFTEFQNLGVHVIVSKRYGVAICFCELVMFS